MFATVIFSRTITKDGGYELTAPRTSPSVVKTPNTWGGEAFIN